MLQERKTYVFAPDATLQEVFERLWEDSITRFYPPETITVQPDENSIASDDSPIETATDKDGIPF